MTTKLGRIIVNSRPTGLDIYLDGKPILDGSGKIAKSPSILSNVPEGMHYVTYSKLGYDDTTITINVREGEDCDARAILSTKFMRYPMMLSPEGKQDQSIESSQPSPGWPAIPVPQIPYGYLVANTIPDGAEIYIDGQPIFDTVGKILTTPASVLGIVAGKHTVLFRKRGYSDVNVEVFIENGLYSDAYAELRPIMVTTKPIVILEPIKGEVTINSTPGGAQIYIDSKLMVDNMGIPIRTPAQLTLNDGWHDMVLYLERYCREASPIYVYPERKTIVHKDLQSYPC